MSSLSSLASTSSSKNCGRSSIRRKTLLRNHHNYSLEVIASQPPPEIQEKQRLEGNILNTLATFTSFISSKNLNNEPKAKENQKKQRKW
ncbi:CLUMA_CG013891, isoform A [Clunio marinus]|uniref:CLUMA_CG013891, isoform A n=1 Tax=Clunio marinus TaxID=568069 RepID=A0A1J1IK65_9DIPT|nr:CLUMA_CG013891, isoform A [Clunio marinus]